MLFLTNFNGYFIMSFCNNHSKGPALKKNWIECRLFF